MKRIYNFIISIISITSLSGQNLVSNPSFEDTVGCPQIIAEYDKCYGWTSAGGTPDYLNACSTPGFVSVPNNTIDYQPAATGNAYFGLATYYKLGTFGDIRENIGSLLSAPLVVGTKYFVSFKANLTLNPIWGSNCATNNIGVLFSTISYDATPGTPITNNPHVFSNSIITDTLGWTNVFGSFVADSAYQFISIGNFFDDSNTDTVTFNPTGDIISYYFIDDVCVTTDSLYALNWTGIQSYNDLINYKVFPNPTHQNAILEFDNSKNENSTLTIYDSYGRLVRRMVNILGNKVEINRQNLTDGLYYFQLQTDRKIIAKGKLIFY